MKILLVFEILTTKRSPMKKVTPLLDHYETNALPLPPPLPPKLKYQVNYINYI